ncbi:MAG: hypothetical protein IT179_21495 [Acidobacteria bacterium]|nr:hypothetical protein [Acidobacteriota bacterium]
MLAVLVVMAGLGAAGCADDDGPTAPTPTVNTLSGTWNGTLSEPGAGTGRLVVVLEERTVTGLGRLLTGGWTVSFPNAGRYDSGSLTGTITDTEAHLLLTPASRPACPTPPGPIGPLPVGDWALEMSVSARRLAGTSLYFTCTTTLKGTVELTR